MIDDSIKKLFNDYNNETIPATEVSLYLHQKNLVQEISGAELILDYIVKNTADRDFQNLLATCRLIYLQALASYNELSQELSFIEYINRCLQTKRFKQRFDSLSSEDKNEFWILVNEIDTAL